MTRCAHSIAGGGSWRRLFRADGSRAEGRHPGDLACQVQQRPGQFCGGKWRLLQLPPGCTLSRSVSLLLSLCRMAPAAAFCRRNSHWQLFWPSRSWGCYLLDDHACILTTLSRVRRGGVLLVGPAGPGSPWLFGLGASIALIYSAAKSNQPLAHVCILKSRNCPCAGHLDGDAARGGTGSADVGAVHRQHAADAGAGVVCHHGDRAAAALPRQHRRLHVRIYYAINRVNIFASLGWACCSKTMVRYPAA